jgi:D-alanine-D-alanine ligase-like ATP-grasp enzyme
LYFLEVNTIPWMTPTSFYPQCVLHAGYPSFADFLHQLIQSKIWS